MSDPKRPYDLSNEQLIDTVAAIQVILWNDDGVWRADNEWDSETIERVAGVMSNVGLSPPVVDESPVPFCQECGNDCVVTNEGVCHNTEDLDINYLLDIDHVAIPEKNS